MIESLPWKSRWRVQVSLKVALFTWTAALGKILMIDNLHHRKVYVIEWCYMCKKAVESIDHLLLHYDYHGEMWSPDVLACSSLLEGVLVMFGVQYHYV